MVVGKRIIVILASLALLYSFGIDKALSQVNVSPPLWPPEYVIGDATIGGQSAQGGVVYLKMAQLCIIFLDGLNDQDDIDDIVAGLNATPAITTSLRQAFLNNTFCQNYDPPLELPGPATVNKKSPTEWEVRDPSGRFRVFTENIKIWQGSSWVPGYKKLQVNMYNGKVASSPISSGSSPYLLEVPVNPTGILWGDGTYILREEGWAMLNDTGYFYIKKDGIERRVTTVDGEEEDPHYLVGQGPFSELDLDAPELIPLDIDLKAGFNLFSIPFNLPNTDLSVVLADIFDCVESIFVLRGGNWYGAAPDHGTGMWDDEIGTIDGGETFVIYMICGDATLSVAGIPLVQTTIILNQGFNLVPYNCAREKTVEEAFGGIRDYVQSIFMYDPVNHRWLGCAPDPAGGWDTEFATLSPGVGIVIYCKADNVPWDVGQ
jgi:hypothetical protein